MGLWPRTVGLCLVFVMFCHPRLEVELNVSAAKIISDPKEQAKAEVLRPAAGDGCIFFSSLVPNTLYSMYECTYSM